MSDIAVLLGDDRIGRGVAARLAARDQSMSMAFNRSAEPRRIVRLLRKRRIGFTELLLMALAEWRRPNVAKPPLAEINDNSALLAWLECSRPRAVVCFRAGLLISPAALGSGVPFYNVHAADLPEFGGLGAIARSLRAGRCEGFACLHRMVAQIDSGEVLEREPYVLAASEGYAVNEERAYAAAEHLLWRALERL
jgi:methionyl-tRNA formyltransferase